MSQREEHVPEFWYYDACALEENKDVFKDVLRKKPTMAVVSHLSLGEAYGNCCHKSDVLRESFLELIDKLRNIKRLKIVGNDGTSKIMEEIKDTVDRISETDLMHISTAIKQKCQKFVTCDHDFCGLTADKKRDIAQIAKDNSSLTEFTILEK